MKKMMAMLLASVMAAGTFTTTAFAYTGDAVQENTAVSTAAQETDAGKEVSFSGKTGYAHGKYLNVTDSAKDSSMFSEDALKLFLDLMQGGLSSESEKESSTALTPEGNMTLVDDIGEEEDKSSQQFITLVTKAGNTFYLIYEAESDDEPV